MIRKLLVCTHVYFWILVLFSAGLYARTIEIRPGSADSITQALAEARPGDVIALQAGIYSGAITVTVSGDPENPIIIRGASHGNEFAPASVIDGGSSPETKKSVPALYLKNASWITVEDIGIQDAWRDPIVIENGAYISLSRCVIRGGQTAVLTKGDATHHVLIEYCTWSQDERVYTKWDWTSLHHGELKIYNGGIYGGDGAGGAVLRHNFVENVFNGLRYWLGDPLADKRMHQANIEVYDNYFRRCRDNIIEPEGFAWNMHVYHNRLDSCPRGVFSIDGVTGGNIYIYGNTGRWNQEGCVEDRAWTIYKSGDYDKKKHLDSPMYIFHNSFSYDTAFVYSSKVKCNDNIIHYNNAYEHLFDLSDIGLKEWKGRSCAFDYDISSRPWHPDVARQGFEIHGIANTDPGFSSAFENRYQLKPDSAAIDRGKDLDGFTLWYIGEHPDLGAYEGDQRCYGKPFLYSPPPGGNMYTEKPRIVRTFLADKRLIIFFSTDIDTSTMTEKDIRISCADKSIAAAALSFPGPAYAAVVTLHERPPQHATKFSITFGRLPRGTNGETATLWAADLRLVRIPAQAVLSGVMTKILK